MIANGTVFVVDDDPSVRGSLQLLLESEGLNVETCGSAAEFLDNYDPTKPACLILDVRMPVMDGLELQDELVRCGWPIPIVFATGTGDVPSCVRAMKAGALDFLEKPVQRDELLPLVRRALEKDRRRLAREVEARDVELRVAKLTSRQKEVMALMCAGNTIKSIAVALGVSIQTAAKHRSHVLAKMDVETDVELTRLLMACEQNPTGGASGAGVPRVQESGGEFLRRVDPASCLSRRRALGSVHGERVSSGR